MRPAPAQRRPADLRHPFTHKISASMRRLSVVCCCSQTATAAKSRALARRSDRGRGPSELAVRSDDGTSRLHAKFKADARRFSTWLPALITGEFDLRPKCGAATFEPRMPDAPRLKAARRVPASETATQRRLPKLSQRMIERDEIFKYKKRIDMTSSEIFTHFV